MSTLSEIERQELSLLLPWYANGTLDSEDSRKVEKALAEDDELAREFDLVLEDQAAVIDLVSEEVVPISMPERFKAALHAEQTKPEPSAQMRKTGESTLTRLLSVLFPAKPRAYAFAAAMMALLVPAVGVVSYMAGSQQTNQYQTATGEQQVISDAARVLVKFNSDAAWADIDMFLKDNQGQVAKGPTADGFYELAFPKNDGLMEKLGAMVDVIEFVLPVN
ncbi:hypothetical protein TRL7639_01237 [Falsiruegeria litorea R37]|uniref:Zinc-finger domain-containing protein n=1 Tax=Falsiruegeria litorea R37 TaxID=1200284 RepID=A0A1Y5S4Z0_9RHOB|nr:hypothetical protein [Falsiruegeria litorea]SLN30178.1 hypothetical protein TRL7639_01237 [Falsiruegeria litorea R37]